MQLIDIHEDIVKQNAVNTEQALDNVNRNFLLAVEKANSTATQHQERMQKWKAFEKSAHEHQNKYIADTVAAQEANFSNPEALSLIAISSSMHLNDAVNDEKATHEELYEDVFLQLGELFHYAGAPAPAPAPASPMSDSDRAAVEIMNAQSKQIADIGSTMASAHRDFTTRHMNRVRESALTTIDQSYDVEEQHADRILRQNDFNWAADQKGHDQVVDMIDAAINKANDYFENGWIPDSPSKTRTMSNTPSSTRSASRTPSRTPSHTTSRTRSVSVMP
jgi:uncharacterized protein YciW